MENKVIENVAFGITNEFIDDVLCTAFEGGITYWCDRVDVKYNDYRGAKYASEVISKGGTLEIVFDDAEFADYDPQFVELTKDKFIKGYKKYVEFATERKLPVYTDAGDIDADIADMIVQYAVFDEVVFG